MVVRDAPARVSTCGCASVSFCLRAYDCGDLCLTGTRTVVLGDKLDVGAAVTDSMLLHLKLALANLHRLHFVTAVALACARRLLWHLQPVRFEHDGTIVSNGMTCGAGKKVYAHARVAHTHISPTPTRYVHASAQDTLQPITAQTDQAGSTNRFGLQHLQYIRE